MQDSVKGSLMLGAVVAARRLRDRGRISPEALEARMSAEALELIDQKIAIARWYPVAVFRELLALDWEISGGRDPAYLVKSGAAAAARMFESGMYQQLDFAERSKKAESRDRLVRQARLITTITGTLYNFLQFDVELGASDLVIVYRNARSLGDESMHTTVGFMNEINERQGSKKRWSASRTSPDEMRFLLPLPVYLSGVS